MKCIWEADEICIPNYKINTEAMRPIGRLSGSYTIAERSFSIDPSSDI
jgi:hypothetical protein